MTQEKRTVKATPKEIVESTSVAHTSKVVTVPCCPEFTDDCPCDVLDFHYRLTHNPSVRVADQERIVPVEVKIHVRFERCPAGLALGDLIYTTTLLPGEKVHLFTSDRRSRFTFDSETKVSYRHEQLAEERYYMTSLNDFMTDLTVQEQQSAEYQSQGSWSGGGSASGFFAGLFGRASTNVRGSHNAASTSEFLRELHSHAQAAERRSVEIVRSANSASIGEVQTRSHAEGESEDHFESSSRVFANLNHCHAVTFYFYQINKKQMVKFTIEAIERRVIDPVADTSVTNNPPRLTGGISVIPSAVLASDKERLEVEALGRQAVAADKRGQLGGTPILTQLAAARLTEVPLPTAVRQEALRKVDQELVTAGLLDKAGEDAKPSKAIIASFFFEHCSSIPTPGVFVKGCIDECNVCEPARQKEIELDLARKDLENKLLERKIELLEKSQEYRCCPGGNSEAKETPDA